MAQQATLYPTLASAVWPSEKASGMVRNVILAVGGTALLTIAFSVDMETALAARHDRQASLAKVREALG